PLGLAENAARDEPLPYNSFRSLRGSVGRCDPHCARHDEKRIALRPLKGIMWGMILGAALPRCDLWALCGKK
ncbi:MAG: hypothetical protein ACPL5I_08570, partial [Thermodesulfobacteriota bacterium]